MPPSALDFSVRAQLTELMDEPCSRDVLRSYLRGLATTNRLTIGYRPTQYWLDSMRSAMLRQGRTIRILDVGSGYGDGLRRIERWCESNGIEAELIGLDLNPDATAIATEASPPNSRIQWVNADVFAFDAPQLDLIVSSLFTHHLADEQIVSFLEWMEARAKLGWFINDLSRAAIPYHFFRAFSRLMRLHPYVQNDGPISIARSFVENDWQRMCTAAGLRDDEFEIQPFKPARLCVNRKTQR
jgi:SAM-dependent methyltransferase